MMFDDINKISEEQDKRQKAFIFLFSCVVFIYQLNHFFPLYADDWRNPFGRSSASMDNLATDITTSNRFR